MAKTAEENGGFLTKESRVLEYWRKRYLTQAVVVAVLCAAAGATAGYYTPFWLLRIFWIMLAFVVAYVMIKELREGLQARGEGLVFAKGDDLFADLVFDVGRGLCENALITQDVVQGYQVRECRNVMHGKGYWLEEDWFYAVVSSKFLPLNQTMFEGVVLAFAATKAADGTQGEVMMSGGRAVVSGGLAPFLRTSGAAASVTAFLALFRAQKAVLFVADKTLYIWIKTNKRLFYQFGLWAPNTMRRFQKRIEALDNTAQQMLKALQG